VVHLSPSPFSISIAGLQPLAACGLSPQQPKGEPIPIQTPAIQGFLLRISSTVISFVIFMPRLGKNIPIKKAIFDVHGIVKL
jgi:hypothetical protein